MDKPDENLNEETSVMSAEHIKLIELGWRPYQVDSDYFEKTGSPIAIRPSRSRQGRAYIVFAYQVAKESDKNAMYDAVYSVLSNLMNLRQRDLGLSFNPDISNNVIVKLCVDYTDLEKLLQDATSVQQKVTEELCSVASKLAVSISPSQTYSRQKELLNTHSKT